MSERMSVQRIATFIRYGTVEAKWCVMNVVQNLKLAVGQ